MQIVALDKTGTITSGEPRSLPIILPAEGVQEEELLTLAYAPGEKERASAGPGSDPGDRKNAGCDDALEVADFQAVPGGGLTGRAGRQTVLTGGNLKYISETAEVPDRFAGSQKGWRRTERPRCSLPGTESLHGIIAVADVIKEDSPAGSARAAEYGYPCGDADRRQ